MPDGPASPQHLRAFVQVDENLRHDANVRFGQDNVSSMLRHITQLWTASFGVVNRQRFTEGAERNGIVVVSDDPVEPFPQDTAEFPPRHGNTTYHVLNGRANVHGNDFSPCVHPIDFKAVRAARMQLSAELAKTRRTLQAVRADLDAANTNIEDCKAKTQDAYEEAAACRSEINSLIHQRDDLSDKCKALMEERDALLTERQALSAERDNLLSSTNDFDYAILKAHVKQLTVQYQTAKGTCHTLRDELKRAGQQLESVANLATQFHAEASAAVTRLQGEVVSVHAKNAELVSQIHFFQGDLYEMSIHEPNKQEGGPAYPISPVPTLPAANTDTTSFSTAASALMQVTRTVSARSTDTPSFTDPEVEPRYGPPPLAAALPDIVAEVLSNHNQPEAVFNLVASTLTLAHPKFSDMFTLLKVSPTSPFGQDLMDALKSYLDVRMLP
jgi:predicted  nucleic acid-binding Zn-ribbon protein